MLVLDNIGLVDFGVRTLWHYVYPVFILVMGLKWLVDYFRRRGSHWFLGLFFIVLGSLLMLDRLEVLTFYFRDVVKLWPLLIIYLGFLLIGFGRHGRSFITVIDGDGKYGATDTEEYVKRETFTVGNREFSQPNWKVEPMNINTLAGDFYLDFSKAFIPEKKIPISIRSMAGDVHILIPEDVDFRINASVKAGEIDVLGDEGGGVNRSHIYETENYESAVRKLDFFIKLKAGSIRVNQV